MNVEQIPANELVVMTPELYQEFCQGGCVPACHFTNEWISIGDKFHLSTVREYGGYEWRNTDRRYEDKDVMLSGAVTVTQYNDNERKIRQANIVDTESRRGGCFRINGKIVI